MFLSNSTTNLNDQEWELVVLVDTSASINGAAERSGDPRGVAAVICKSSSNLNTSNSNQLLKAANKTSHCVGAPTEMSLELSQPIKNYFIQTQIW